MRHTIELAGVYGASRVRVFMDEETEAGGGPHITKSHISINQRRTLVTNLREK